MLRSRPLCALALSFMAGAALSCDVNIYSVLFAVAVAAALFAMLFFPYPDRGTLVVFVLAMIMLPAGYFRYERAHENITWNDGVYISRGDHVTGEAFIEDIKESDDRLTIFLSSPVLSCDGKNYITNKLVGYWDIAGTAETLPDVFPGCRVSFTGEAGEFSIARNPGAFDLKSYYMQKGFDFPMSLESLHVEAPGSAYREGLFRIKQSVRRTFGAVLSEDEYGFMCAIILGDRSDLGEDLKELYRQGGLLHILAISGLHISLLGMMAFSLLRRAGVGFLAAAVPSGFVVYSYCLMCGMGVSMERALIMYFIMLAANIFGEGYDCLNALSAAAIVILIKNPLLILSVSFRLSFSAVIGAGSLSPALIRILNAKSGIVKSFLLCFSIQLTTIPVILLSYYEIPVYGIILNIFLLPMVPVILLSGVACGVTGMIAVGAARVVIMPARFVMWIYHVALEAATKLPGSGFVVGAPDVSRVFIYYVFLTCALCLICKIRKERQSAPPRLPYKERLRTRINKRLKSVLVRGAAAIAFMSFLYAIVFTLTYSKRPELAITMLDVGQGDGISVEHRDGTVCFFDGGSSDNSSCGKYVIEPFLKYSGIGRVDHWFVSHTDADHISGLTELLEAGYRVENLYFAKGMVYDEATAKLISLAKESGTHVWYLVPGDTLTLGDDVYTCIFPEVDNSYTDKNDACLVMRLDHGDFSALFTGDLTADGEEYLKSGGMLDDVTLLKVGHHGSKTSSTADFLEVLRPKECIISCGVNNRYGHPAPETMERLLDHTEMVYVTTDCGAITIRVEDGAVRTKRYLDKTDP